jgi:Glycosyltransferase family 87
MIRARADGLLLLGLGSLILVLLGFALESSMPGTMGDFRMQYFPARCLLQHGDPYRQEDVLRTYRAERRGQAQEPLGAQLMTTEYIYPPTAFALTVPLAIWGYGPAHNIWMAASCIVLIMAGLAVWDLGSSYAPTLSGFLAGFLLANCELILTNGNVAGIAVGLAVIFVWCVFQNRFVPFGILCLALGLALKPHDTWLVWAFFLLAGRTYRRRAFEVVLVAAAVSLPYVLWVTHVSPHWTRELHSNMASIALLGGTDPGIGGTGGLEPTMIIDLQAAIGFFSHNANLYNPASYLICGMLLLLWGTTALRLKPTTRGQLLALSVIAPLTLLPVYHRECDAKLLLLTIPACALLWSEGGTIARIAVVITVLGLFVSADIPWAIDVGLVKSIPEPRNGLAGQLLRASQMVTVPASLLIESAFFLWVYIKRSADAPAGNRQNGHTALVPTIE